MVKQHPVLARLLTMLTLLGISYIMELSFSSQALEDSSSLYFTSEGYNTCRNHVRNQGLQASPQQCLGLTSRPILAER